MTSTNVWVVVETSTLESDNCGEPSYVTAYASRAAADAYVATETADDDPDVSRYVTYTVVETSIQNGGK